MLIISIIVTSFLAAVVQPRTDSKMHFLSDGSRHNCYRGWYKIPLWSERTLPIVLNRTSLLQHEIVSIVFRAEVDNFKAIQLENNVPVITTHINLTGDSPGKRCKKVPHFLTVSSRVSIDNNNGELEYPCELFESNICQLFDTYD